MNRNTAPSTGASSAYVDEYWDNLTDEQLLAHVWFTERPRSLEGLQELIPANLEEFQVELEYQLEDSDDAVPCAHCPQHQKHRHGFVLKAPDGRRWLLGSVCGPKAYGSDYRIASQARNRAKRRWKALTRWREVRDCLPDLIDALSEAEQSESFKTIRRQRGAFRANAMRALGRLIIMQPNHLTGALEMRVTTRYRDVEEEARRKEEFLAAVSQLASLPNKEHRQRHAELKARYRVGEEIYVEDTQDFGVLRSPSWLLNNADPAKVIADVSKRLHALSAIIATTQDKKTSYLERLPNDLKHELTTASTALRLIREANNFLDADNLMRLGNWLGAQNDPWTSIRFSGGILYITDEAASVTATLGLPPNWTPPGDLFLELAAEAL